MSEEKIYMSTSEALEMFIQFFKDAEQDYRIAKITEDETNEQTQDILHRLEFGEDTYHDRAKLAKGLKEIRKKRREAQNTEIILEPIINYLAQNQRLTKELEKTLGEVRKAEGRTKNRQYTNRTSVINEILK